MEAQGAVLGRVDERAKQRIGRRTRGEQQVKVMKKLGRDVARRTGTAGARAVGRGRKERRVVSPL
eukprot:724650-Pleurochrysis_carterae.AAC.2